MTMINRDQINLLQLAPNAKKIWEDDVANKGGGDGKTMFHPGANPWTPRDDAWSNAPSGNRDNMNHLETLCKYIIF